MESLLNLFWALLSLLIVCLWFRFGARDENRSSSSFVALFMLILILFPVISVSDDLWSLQNPAETDTCQRRDPLALCPHSIFPAAPALPALAFALPQSGFEFIAMAPQSPAPAIALPTLDAIQNRPPPAA